MGNIEDVDLEDIEKRIELGYFAQYADPAANYSETHRAVRQHLSGLQFEDEQISWRRIHFVQEKFGRTTPTTHTRSLCARFIIYRLEALQIFNLYLFCYCYIVIVDSCKILILSISKMCIYYYMQYVHTINIYICTYKLIVIN